MGFPKQALHHNTQNTYSTNSTKKKHTIFLGISLNMEEIKSFFKFRSFS